MSKVYSSCDLLPISLFHEILKTSDYTLLYQDYENLEKKPTNEEIYALWEDVYDEYLGLIKDENISYYFELEEEVIYLNRRYETAFFMIKQISDGVLDMDLMIAYVNELSKWGYVIDLSKDLDDELNKAVRQLKASRNKINLREGELKELKKSMDKNVGSMSLIEQAARLEQGLGRENIDIDKTVVTKWFILLNLLEEINRAKRKANVK